VCVCVRVCVCVCVCVCPIHVCGGYTWGYTCISSFTHIHESRKCMRHASYMWRIYMYILIHVHTHIFMRIYMYVEAIHVYPPCISSYMYLHIHVWGYTYMWRLYMYILGGVHEHEACLMYVEDVHVYPHTCTNTYMYILHRPRMEKSHSKHHELSLGGLVSILIVLIAPQKSNYLHYQQYLSGLICLYNCIAE